MRLSELASALFCCLILCSCACRKPIASARDDSSATPRGVDQGQLNSIVTLPQGWSEDDAIWFYGQPQGSLMIPYEWFLHLERADNEELFRDAEHIRRLGYLPRSPTRLNPDGLPVGFTKDHGTNRSWLGMTCAACHTTQINYEKNGYLIDGGPGLGDLESLLRELVDALNATARPENSARLERFASRLLGHSPNSDEKKLLRDEILAVTKLRENYNKRNLARESAKSFGYARYDAFGAIFNEGTARFLGYDDNARESNAPVNYPHIWDTPQHDFVQWNGMARNAKLGDLARNVGEVMGVFGDVEVPEEQPVLGYASSIQIPNLREIENRIASLQSPQWPSTFPAINKKLADRGRELFIAYCRSCHADIDRVSPTRKIIAELRDTGTDPTMAANFLNRTAKTRQLKGKKINFNPVGKEFESTADAGDILIHLTVGAIIGGWKEAPRDVLAQLEFEKRKRMGVDFMEENVPNKFKYKARPLNGIWATAPFLHNGSVPSLYEVLLPASERSKVFWVGNREFDPSKVGFIADEKAGLFRFDTSVSGNSNAGHEYGVGKRKEIGGDDLPPLSNEQRKELLEYLKTL